MENSKKGDTSRYKKGEQAVKDKTKYYTTGDNRKTTTIQVLTLTEFKPGICKTGEVMVEFSWSKDCVKKNFESGR